MIPEQELLEPHERVIERFNAQIMRKTNGRWTHTVPAIYVILTDLRIIFQPQTRKRYEPAIIPLRYVRMVKRLKAARNGLSLHLKSGPTIYLFASWNGQTDLVELIQVLAEIPYARDYEAPLPVPEIRKLIEFVRDI